MARQLGMHVIELCCIRFFAVGLALGDVVHTDEDYFVDGVVQASGKANFSLSRATDGLAGLELTACRRQSWRAVEPL